MPGIFENGDESINKASENGSSDFVQPETSESSTEETSTPREISQTDRLNKFLLKSFLEHINNQTINVHADSVERNDVSDCDWN